MKNCKRIEIKKAARKFLNSCSYKNRVRLMTKIYELPDSTQTKKMERYDNRYRLRVGDFRVLYELNKEITIVENETVETIILVILILDIGNRETFINRS